MSPRSIRRAAERKQKKLERKANIAATLAPASGADDSSLRPPFKAALEQTLPPTQTTPQLLPAKPGHSTGPRTEDGKKVSSRNAFKHGLASGELLVPGECREDFDRLLADLLEEHQPSTATEHLLVHEIAQSFWLTQRAIRLQNSCFAGEEVDARKLALFLRYQTTYERAFHKALAALLKLKLSRAREQAVSNPKFVSQNAPDQNRDRQGADALPKFVSQNSGRVKENLEEREVGSPLKTPENEPATLSEAKIQNRAA